jgi:UDP-N-acetylglucosamine 2-epimerase (non-hydrolysing)
VADYLFTTDHFADENLRAEGVPPEKIFFVGNVMIDTLVKHRELAKRLDLMQRWGMRPREFATLTLHRPSNVDDPATLDQILGALAEIAREVPVIFPAHPRTQKIIREFSLGDHFTQSETPRGLWMTEPLGYLEFLHLNMHARMVLTDSGGLQEEATVLGIPCITLRNNTERPITCEVGMNFIAGNSPQGILAAARRVLEDGVPTGSVPERWDGRAAERIVQVLMDIARTTP